MTGYRLRGNLDKTRVVMKRYPCSPLPLHNILPEPEIGELYKQIGYHRMRLR